MKAELPNLRKALTSFWGKWFLLAILIGLVVGVAAIIFQYSTQMLQQLVLGYWSGFHPNEAAGEYFYIPDSPTVLNVWMILPVIGLGGLATGVLVYWVAPSTAGPGTDGAIDAFHNQRGKIALRVPIVKTIASAITLGTGGSAGREGPIAQIGAGLGSYMAQRMGLSAHDRRIMLAVGMAAGVGAIFRAPLAAAIFAGEILYRDADIEADVIIPGAVASTVAYSVFQVSLPEELRFKPLFGEQLQHQVSHFSELIPYTLLAVLVVIAAGIYVNSFRLTDFLFKQIPVLPHFKPCIGALLAGLIAIGVYYLLGQDENSLASLGSGYGFLQNALGNVSSLSVTMLFAVAATKIVTTSLTTGSGGSGGVFGPSMVIGGSLGAGVGKLLHNAFPAIVTQPSTFAIVGMAGFFAGCANAPFSTILMVTEMTGDYKLLVPTLWVSTICYIMCRRWSLYASQVNSRIESPAHRGDFTIDLLEGMLVRDVYRDVPEGITFHEDASLDEIVHALDDSPQRYFHVYNSEERLVGVFSVSDVRRYLYDDVLWKIAIASDVMIEKVIKLELDDDLNTALNQFTAWNVEELPVIAAEDKNKVVGVLRRKEAIAAYNTRRLELQKQKDDDNT